MIRFDGVSKSFPARAGRRVILNNLTLTLPAGARTAVLGRNGAGKSTFLAMASGSLPPDRGHVARAGRVSWPMGFAGSFAADMTGAQNTRFLARVYGADPAHLVRDVQSFADLGRFIDMPLRTYSNGMRARLAFGLSLGLRFDWYLVDEITAVGDAEFRQKALSAFRERLSGAGLLMVSHSPATLRDYCTSAILLGDGSVRVFDRLDDGLAALGLA
jgi:capsular polysaccharide transport system ATP-binding protein